jgi:hypothetical protein
MKNILPVFFITVVFLFSCGGNEKKSGGDSVKSDTVKKVVAGPGNGFNYVDANGKRQGKWIILGAMRPDLKTYNQADTVEWGFYKDGKKAGTWLIYAPGNKVAGDSAFPE